jgi:hypothetical protein
MYVVELANGQNEYLNSEKKHNRFQAADNIEMII